MAVINQYGTRVVSADGRTIRTSRNLRGMCDYARVSRVVSAVVQKTNEGRGLLLVTYADGATCSASFDSFTVMMGWVRKRRSWREAVITYASGDVGTIAGV